MRMRSLIPECPELSYFVTIHLTGTGFCRGLQSQIPLISDICWCSVLLLALALNTLLVKALAQGRKDLCIHWEINHLDGKADSCKKEKDS